MVSWFSVHDATFSPKMFVCSFIPLTTFLQGFFLMVRHKADILYTPNRFCPVKKAFFVVFMKFFPLFYNIFYDASLVCLCALPGIIFNCSFDSKLFLCLCCLFIVVLSLLPDSCCDSFIAAAASFLTAAVSHY